MRVSWVGSYAKALRQEKANWHWDYLTQEKGRIWGAARQKARELGGGQFVKGLTWQPSSWTQQGATAGRYARE